MEDTLTPIWSQRENQVSAQRVLPEGTKALNQSIAFVGKGPDWLEPVQRAALKKNMANLQPLVLKIAWAGREDHPIGQVRIGSAVGFATERPSRSSSRT